MLELCRLYIYLNLDLEEVSLILLHLLLFKVCPIACWIPFTYSTSQIYTQTFTRSSKNTDQILKIVQFVHTDHILTIYINHGIRELLFHE